MKFSTMVNNSLTVQAVSESKQSPPDPQALAWWMDKSGYKHNIKETINVSHPIKGKATVLEVNSIGVTVKWKNPLQAITGTELIEFRDVHFLEVLGERYSDKSKDVMVDLDHDHGHGHRHKSKKQKHKHTRKHKKHESKDMKKANKIDEGVIGMAPIGGMGVGYATGREKEYNFDLTAADLGLLAEEDWAPDPKDTILTNQDKQTKPKTDPLSGMEGGSDVAAATQWDGTQVMDDPIDAPDTPAVKAQDDNGTGIPGKKSAKTSKKASTTSKETPRDDVPQTPAPKNKKSDDSSEDTKETKGKDLPDFLKKDKKEKKKDDDVNEDITMTAEDLGLIREMDNPEDDYNFEGYGSDEFGEEGQKVKITNRDDEFYGKTGTVQKSANGASTIKLDIDTNQNIVSFNDDEYELIEDDMMSEHKVGTAEVAVTVELLKNLLLSVASQSPDEAKIDAIANGLASAIDEDRTLDVSDMAAIKSAMAAAYGGASSDEEAPDDDFDDVEPEVEADDLEYEDKAEGDGEEAGAEGGEEHEGKTKMMDCDCDGMDECSGSDDLNESRQNLNEEFIGMAAFPSTFISSFERQHGAPIIAEDDPLADIKAMRRKAGIKNWWKIK